ncbi:hypothetical protein [Halosimplex pelagicum]|nr:hypothetical protein [Halosimplex pelagicum]
MTADLSPDCDALADDTGAEDDAETVSDLCERAPVYEDAPVVSV